VSRVELDNGDMIGVSSSHAYPAIPRGRTSCGKGEDSHVGAQVADGVETEDIEAADVVEEVWFGIRYEVSQLPVSAVNRCKRTMPDVEKGGSGLDVPQWDFGRVELGVLKDEVVGFTRAACTSACEIKRRLGSQVPGAAYRKDGAIVIVIAAALYGRTFFTGKHQTAGAGQRAGVRLRLFCREGPEGGSVWESTGCGTPEGNCERQCVFCVILYSGVRAQVCWRKPSSRGVEESVEA
jgi:hypothetical protein